jgi:hypothetical protein
VTQQDLGVVVETWLIAFEIPIQWAKDVTSKVQGRLTWEKIGMGSKKLPSDVIRQLDSTIVMNEESATVEELRGCFFPALLRDDSGSHGITMAGGRGQRYRASVRAMRPAKR